MSAIRYARHDFSLRVSTSAPGEMTWRLAWGETVRTETVSSLELLVAIAAQEPRPAIQQVLSRLDLPNAFISWNKWVDAQPHKPDERPLRRIALHLDEPALAAAPWERHLREAGLQDCADVAAVRVSPVRPRVAQVPFTLPLRFLQLDPDGFDLAACIRTTFGSGTEDALAETYRAQAGPAIAFADHQAPPNWRTVDVVHLGPAVVQSSGKEWLRTLDARAVGTLGWLLRISEAWQTRLVMIEAEDSDHQNRARKLAAALCARGGPAVVVGPLAKLDPPTPGFYRSFYDALVHDNPIDQAYLKGRDGIRNSGQWQNGDGLSLFAGQAREELIRVSEPGQKLHDLAEALRSPDPKRGREAAGELWSTIWEPEESLDNLSRRFSESVRGLEGLRSRWRTLHFENHESEGVIPSATNIESIRRAIRPSGPRATLELRPATEQEPRFANPALWRASVDGRSELIDPRAARIAPDEELVLGIQIGPRDTFVPVIEAQALLEEPFKWQSGQIGAWLTLGVSGIDFEILGHPTQQVWLPRAGATDVVEFSLKPRKSGASMLRFCLYFGSALLQSYRLTAWIGDDPIEPAQVSGALARILETTEEKVGAARYLARLEYAATTELVKPVQDEAVLSVFANDVDGRRVVTVWNGEDLDVSTDKNVSLISQGIRRVLDDVSGGKFSDGERYYVFGKGPEQKGGDPQDLARALEQLAPPGWELYLSILAKPARERLKARPDVAGGIVHVGHALLENVIPWALVYDREYDSGKDTVDGLPALHAVCAAGLDGGQGLPPACGQHPDCPLSPAKQAEQRYAGKLADAETVVCPRHFWGFRYRIELPPMQVEAGQQPARPRTQIAALDPASVVIGYNAVLPLATSHVQDLTTLAPSRAVRAAISGASANRSALMSLLASRDIDLLYFFCHARGGQADPSTESPQLEFQENKTAPPGRIGWENLDKFEWGHGPLVFLNGCNTAMFSPDALSPFIRTVVSSCGAAGAVGTEIPVFEQLAATFAKSFFGRLLDGASAGQALLDTRLEFLQHRNPLGLAYTLYAFSGLTIVQTPAHGGV